MREGEREKNAHMYESRAEFTGARKTEISVKLLLKKLRRNSGSKSLNRNKNEVTMMLDGTISFYSPLLLFFFLFYFFSFFLFS